MANENSMVASQTQRKVSPAERTMLFSQLTREHVQELPAKTATESGTVSFEIPKARLLSKLSVLVEGTVKLTHTSVTTVPTKNELSPFNLIKKIEINLNNGFSPFIVSGRELYIYNLLKKGANMIVPVCDTATNVAASRKPNVLGVTASSGGTDNKFRMILDLPLTLNERDPQGLILLQNSDILVNMNVTLGSFVSDVYNQAGLTAAVTDLRIKPIAQTFSIPSIGEALPDLSILKLVQSRTQSISGAGEQVVQLQAGNIYRKLIVFVEDANGGEADGDLNTTFDLVLNTADTPYKVPHRYIAAQNMIDYEQPLPVGVYVFDFTRSGAAPNFGGSRDYLDTERLTEFWLKFTAAAAGQVTVIAETLARVKMS